ncbi:hypothetical protein Tco_0867896 [Tanacetum coccineum]
MSTVDENVIAMGAENSPPMLERSQYDSWQSCMLLYIQGTTTTPATTRERTLDYLTPAEKIREACDIKETNIILQGLPPDVYSLVNHHTVAKEIWDRVKLLMEGSELSLQERESKLYNEFDRFTSEKGETIHSYYLRFAKLINDMNTIGMKCLEWSKFVTDVKLAKDMHNVSFNQLYAYLRQHEAYANEVRMMRQRFSDALALTYEALVVHHQPYEALVFHQQAYQAPAVHQQSPAILEHGLSRIWEMLLQTNQGSFDVTTAKTDDLDMHCIFQIVIKHLQQVQSSWQTTLLMIQMFSLSDINVISYDQYLKENESEVIQGTTSSEQQDAMIMSVIDEMSNQVAKCNAVNQENKIMNESLTVELERYKEMVKIFEQRQKFKLTDREKYINSQMRGIIVDQNAKSYAFQKEIQTLKFQLSANIKDNKSLKTQIDVLKKESSKKQDKYIEEIVDLEKKKKALDNIGYLTSLNLPILSLNISPSWETTFHYRPGSSSAIT